MRPVVQEQFNALIRRWPPPGPRVLELGATAETARGFATVLDADGYVGLDLAPDDEARRLGIQQGDANAMPQFADGSFDAVVTSSMFEHDARFWLTTAEVRRVLVHGGRFYVGVPGFADRMSTTARYARAARNRLNRIGWRTPAEMAGRVVATRTYPFHLGPHDYFRFSPQGVTTALLDGFEALEVRTVGSPPFILAAGQLQSSD